MQVWTEASSLRHCPEALWFFYHTMAMSPAAEAMWAAAPGVMATAGARERRIIVRNVMQVKKELSPGCGAPTSFTVTITWLTGGISPERGLSCLS